MNLHEEKEIYKDAVTYVAQYTGISATIVEKDYWVSCILKRISDSDYSDNIIFKGGTSLSKAFKLIERFSEDIDLAIVYPHECSNNSGKERFLKKVAKTITAGFTEVEIPGTTSKKGRFRKAAYNYPYSISGNSNDKIKDNIIVEINSFTKPEPNFRKIINSIIAEYISENQPELIEFYSLKPFHINVLDFRRTFIEKIFSIIRHSYNENAIEELKRKIRHLYDICILLGNVEIESFIYSDEFSEMIKKVKDDDKNNSHFNGIWLEEKWSDSIIFKETEKTWNNLERSYNIELKKLVYGNLPSAENIKSSVRKIGSRLKDLGY